MLRGVISERSYPWAVEGRMQRDVTGQRVARLASGFRQAGTYALRWDGRDDAGRRHRGCIYTGLRRRL
jgi:hypothetical protein